MARRWWWVVAAAAVPLAVLAWDRLQVVYWVGRADLEVEFLVTDAVNGNAVEGADISIHSEGGFYQEREEKEFVLRTERDGTARRVCHRSMSFGKRSGFGFTDTFAVHLPWWTYGASAPGYEPSELAYVDVPENWSRSRRMGPGLAKVVVPVTVHRASTLND
jgi:hypothetical protein